MPLESQRTLAEEITEAPPVTRPTTSPRLHFSPVAPQGFGDRHNTWAWSMLWWRGKLYVGTNRAFHCTERAALSAAFPLFAWFPFVKYPPDDPDTECTPRYVDLPLRAEIWRWTPETETWERVYQSPQDVPIPGHPGKYVARDVGFRDMAAFVEPDGTEAMYVSGVSSQFIYRRLPPPRLLRSTDGLTFEPIPHQPGTCLGELKESTFRTMAAYQGRLFVIGDATIYGDGVLLESSNPAAGNDHFRQVSPADMRVFEMFPFNGCLYLGLRDPKRGYAVVKTEANGSPPYAFTPVVTDGAFLSPPSQSVISMHVYKGRLYVGTDGPAELIRINRDDTWDLVIGTSRETPDGWKHPISGLDAGFHNWLNGHIWRLQTHEGRLYLGTMNTSTHLRNIPGADRVLKPNYGFDLFETDDGWHYAPLTVNGFGDKFAFGVRSFASTPQGLCLGTANSWYGLQIWRGTAGGSRLDAGEAAVTGTATPHDTPEGRSQNIRAAVYHQRAANPGCQPPEHLEVESHTDRVVLSWACSTAVKQFRIWRADVSDERRNVERNPFLARLLPIIRALLALKREIYVARLPDKLWIPGAYLQIAVTGLLHFEDTTAAAAQKRYLYYVEAESHTGDLSGPSNIVAIPSLRPSVTFDRVLKALDGAADKVQSGATQEAREIRGKISRAHAFVRAGDTMSASTLLQELSGQLAAGWPETLDELILADIQILLLKLSRRVALSREGLISPAVL